VGRGISVNGSICYMVHYYLHCWLAHQRVVFMNERIRELAEQATSYNNSDGWLFDKEKFAELIVKECANYITEYYPHSRYEAFYMKKHFGVE
jgi:hypothetical protein